MGCAAAGCMVMVFLGLCFGSLWGVIWLWTLLGGVLPQMTYNQQVSAITALSWSPNGTFLASASESNDQEPGSVQVWNARTGQVLLTYRGLSSLQALAWSPNGERIAVVGRLVNDSEQTPAVQILDATTGDHVLTLRFSNVYSVSWSPDSRYIVTAADNGVPIGRAQVWDAQSGRAIFSEGTDSSDAQVIAWSPDGKRIAAGGAEGIIKVWDALTGAHDFDYRGHLSENNGSGPPGHIVALAWSPNSQWIASADDNEPPSENDSNPDYSTVRVWQPFEGGRTVLYPLKASSLAWSPDSRRIVAASKKVRVWDAVNGDHLFYYTGGFGASSTTQVVTWSPDGTSIASGNSSGQVQIWQPPAYSAFLGHSYSFDVLKIALLTSLAGGLFLCFSLRPFARIGTRITRQTSGAQPVLTRHFSPRNFLLGLLILCVGAVAIWGMVNYGWDIHIG
jgi:WD40 repeat protein